MSLNQTKIKEIATVTAVAYLNFRKEKVEANQRKLMYEIFTPFHVIMWHKIIGKKPYLDVNYKSKLLQKIDGA
jgi:hypothetical protein